MRGYRPVYVLLKESYTLKAGDEYAYDQYEWRTIPEDAVGCLKKDRFPRNAVRRCVGWRKDKRKKG